MWPSLSPADLQPEAGGFELDVTWQHQPVKLYEAALYDSQHYVTDGKHTNKMLLFHEVDNLLCYKSFTEFMDN